MTGLADGMDLGVRKKGSIFGLSNWINGEGKGLEIYFWEMISIKMGRMTMGENVEKKGPSMSPKIPKHLETEKGRKWEPGKETEK